jgi:hypothetical protein
MGLKLKQSVKEPPVGVKDLTTYQPAVGKKKGGTCCHNMSALQIRRKEVDRQLVICDLLFVNTSK